MMRKQRKLNFILTYYGDVERVSTPTKFKSVRTKKGFLIQERGEVPAAFNSQFCAINKQVVSV